MARTASYFCIGLALAMAARPAEGRAAWPPYVNDVAPVYRLFNADIDDHLFTRDRNEADAAQSAGFVYEGTPFFVSRGGGAGLIPLYRYYRPDIGHLYGT